MKKIWNWLGIENNRKVLSFLGTGIVVVVGAGWTYFTYHDRDENKEKAATTAFAGSYAGVITEGTTRRPIEITFEQLGNSVTGSYTLSEMQGKMAGTVTNNAFHYEWKLGGVSGLRVSMIHGDTIEGTWGFGNSHNDAGTLTAQLQ